MTGWEITLDLIRKLAVARGEPEDVDPEAWYWEHFDKEPEYSELMGHLARTQSERRGLLREYFEPKEDDRAAGRKMPTPAHTAVAKLVAGGFVKLIVTTIFDDLIEQALREQGIQPVIWITPDEVKGRPPLDHIDCCVLKLNGDYRDARMLNTTVELEKYEPEVETLLDKILDDYGLIISGWSATYDLALRKAISRSQSRRYTTFWNDIGQPDLEAQNLIAHRGAQLAVGDADSFFMRVQQTVEAIDAVVTPHPLTAAVAVRRLKDYLPTPGNRIVLQDLVNQAVGEVVEVLSKDDVFDVG